MRVAVLFALLALPFPAFAADCPGCLPPDNLCVKHEEKEAEALKAFRKVKKDKDPMKRVAGLEALGKVNDEHTGTYTKDMAQAIGEMLEDTDSGIRLKAAEFLTRNQHKETAAEEIGKVLKKILPKLDKPKPGVKAGKAMEEWDNSYKFGTSLLTSLQTLALDECVEPLVLAVKCRNLEFANLAITASSSIRDKRFIQAYLDRMESLDPGKDEGNDYTYAALAAAFKGMSGFTEEFAPGAADKWLANAMKFWRQAEATWTK